MTNVNQVLAEREKQHGVYSVTAFYIQELKHILHNTQWGGNWNKLTYSQQETFDMIASKLGRILSGNPNVKDHWVDIAGYAMLVANELGDGHDTGRQDQGEGQQSPSPR